MAEKTKNGLLQQSFGRALQENPGYAAPGDDILSNVRDYFAAYQGIGGLAPEEQAAAQNALGANQFTDANGFTYIAQPYQNGVAGRNLFYAYKPGEIERARATGKRAKAGAFDANTGDYLFEQEMTSKADSARGLKLGLAAVGGLFGAGQLGLLGPGAAGASGSGAVGAMGPLTEAQTLAQAATLQSELAPYLASGAAGGAAGGATSGLMGPPTAAQSAASAAGLQAELAPYATGLTTTGGAGAGVTTKGLLDAASKYGPAVLSVAAGVAGGASGDEEKKVTRDLPDWIRPYILGTDQQPGLLQLTQQAYSHNQPALLESVQRLRNSAAGLLATPVRGNGYGLLNGGK